uniref:Uncharacterized protein n=1 Tax=Arundo donax TaxID=35708 RepID=A0A0A9TF33_ARUDO
MWRHSRGGGCGLGVGRLWRGSRSRARRSTRWVAEAPPTTEAADAIDGVSPDLLSLVADGGRGWQIRGGPTRWMERMEAAWADAAAGEDIASTGPPWRWPMARVAPLRPPPARLPVGPHPHLGEIRVVDLPEREIRRRGGLLLLHIDEIRISIPPLTPPFCAMATTSSVVSRTTATVAPFFLFSTPTSAAAADSTAGGSSRPLRPRLPLRPSVPPTDSSTLSRGLL